MSRRSRVGPGAWFFLALWLLLLAGGRERLFRDPGTFWHVRVGERVLDTGRLVTTEPYTFTFGGTPWTPHGWLAEVGMAALHRLAGIDALLLASAALIAATFTIPFVRLVRAGLHWSVAGCLVGLAVAASASHFHARPHLLTLLLFALTAGRLSDYEAGRNRITGLLRLVPLFALWANVHGGVVGGYGTVGLAVAGWLGFRLIGWPSPVRSRGDGLRLIGWAALVGLTALATPYGTDMPRAWAAIMRMPELTAIIQEHAAVDPADVETWPYFTLGLVYAGALAGLRERPRVTWLLPVVWFALGCERVRHGPLFAVAAAVAFADLFPRTIWATRLAARPDLYRPPAVTGTRRGSEWPGVALCAGLLLACVSLQAGGVRVPLVGAGWAAWPEAQWPVSLVSALQREAAGRTGLPIFNEFEFGGFLIYFAPEYRPFVDDRCEVYGGPWLADYVAAGGDPAPAMARWQAEYGRFSFALTKPGSGYDGYFAGRPGEWELVESAPAGRLYRRK